ncbi:hypothetical protein BCR36DRAFT_583909 [Piromyces finnis]|uniref:Uncharacterized protein n=1 Tax=Piromyces finnis TaxID=1754191 RepID=A0A1Y1V8W8_9FUNG|nr:hypothetical protein BCR36DRAFT_583909 [Piromyces finnis]|eukprot:ORX49313.1 hypothetical protein BCR36DRAFT_583909 [Piromyces finnis]
MGDLNLVKYLIENEDFKYTAEGINTKDLKEKYPIIEALSTKNIEIFDYLLEKGANYNTISRNGVPLIFLAIYNNNVDFIYSLINDETCDKININGYDRNEYTPLIASYVNDSTDIFNYLLEYSDINKKDRNGHNILYYAIEKNDRTNVENFINIGIELNNDAINIAIDEYDEYIIKYLLDFIPYSYHNDIGEPLLTAIINHKSNLCKYEYIEILLKNGYNKNIKDWNGRTPLWHAEQKYDDYKKRNLNYNIYCNINNNTYYKIIQLLKKYGAK